MEARYIYKKAQHKYRRVIQKRNYIQYIQEYKETDNVEDYKDQVAQFFFAKKRKWITCHFFQSNFEIEFYKFTKCSSTGFFPEKIVVSKYRLILIL